MKILKFVKSSFASLVFNFAYALGNSIIGFAINSWWFVTMGEYYLVLSVTRFSVLKIQKRSKGDEDLEQFAKRITGILLIVLSFCLVGINVLSVVEQRGTNHNEIVMITIALYAFTKVTLSIIGMFKTKKISSPVLKTLRNISFADAVVSIYSLQRSMLISFPGMETEQIKLFNILTGTAVWLIVLILGLNLFGGRFVNMAKSKIVKTNKKIAETVVGGYKKIEKGVVDGYKKIEDKFIDAYLTKEGETVEEAKARLIKENK